MVKQKRDAKKNTTSHTATSLPTSLTLLVHILQTSTSVSRTKRVPGIYLSVSGVDAKFEENRRPLGVIRIKKTQPMCGM